MMRAVRTALMMLVIPVMSAAQASVHGGWQGVIADTGGDASLAMEITVEGTDARGSMVIDGAEQYIAQAQVTGDGIQFTTARLRTTDRDVRYQWTGVQNGDQITFTVVAEDRDGPAREIVVTRQAR